METQFQFKMFVKTTGEKREIEGFASTPDLDRDGDIIPTQVLESAIEDYIKMGTLLYEHGYDPTYARKPIGKLNVAKIDDQGRLYVKGRISDQWIWEKIKLGELQAFSVGGRAEWETQEKNGEVVGVAKNMEIHEVSVVAIPANPNALFTIAKALKDSFKQLVKGEQATKSDKNIYNKDIPLTDKIMEDLIKGLQDKFDAFVSGDNEKVELKKSLEEKTNQMSELQAQLDEQKSKNEELQKSLDEAIASKEALANDIKALDEKLTALVSVKKSAKTDEEVEKAVEEVVDSSEVVEKNAKALGLVL